MAETAPDQSGHRVVIVGGGVAALEAMLALRALAEERVQIDLLAPEPWFWYRPLASVEPFGAQRTQHFELAAFARACDARFYLGATVVAVDPDAKFAYSVIGRATADRVPYDSLILATGTRPRTVLTDAITFRGPAEADAVRYALQDFHHGRVRRLVFAVPPGPGWPLPLYELALQSAHRLGGRADIVFVTPEAAPLAMFGEAASEAVGRMFAEHAVGFVGDAAPESAIDGVLRLTSGQQIAYDRLISLPRLQGDPPAGVPRDADRFVPVDDHGRVDGLDGVWAAGDATSFPIKQGGLAAQQADAVAEDIAASVGAAVEPHPFRPVLRALLVTGGKTAFLRHDPAVAGSSTIDSEPLWWPPAKIAGRYLAPFLAEHNRLTPAERVEETHTAFLEVVLDADARAEAAAAFGD